MAVDPLTELYGRAQDALRGFGECRFISRADGYVQFVCYDALIFRISLPEHPYSSYSIRHLLGERETRQELLGHDLTFVEITEEAFAAAFEVVREFSRLRLPDKYLDAWEKVELRKRS